MLLQIVAFTGDVGRDFDAIAKPNSGNLAQSGIGLLGSHSAHLGAHSPLLRISPAVPETPLLVGVVRIAQRWRFALALFLLAPLSHQLIDGGQECPLSYAE
jgi:hypothetical protein